MYFVVLQEVILFCIVLLLYNLLHCKFCVISCIFKAILLAGEVPELRLLEV